MNLFIILIIFYFLLYFFITKPNTKNNFFIIFFFSKYFLIIKYNLNKIQKYQIFEPFFSFLPFSQIKLCVFNYPFFLIIIIIIILNLQKEKVVMWKTSCRKVLPNPLLWVQNFTINLWN